MLDRQGMLGDQHYMMLGQFYYWGQLQVLLVAKLVLQYFVVGVIGAMNFVVGDVHSFVLESIFVAWDTELVVLVQNIDYMPFDRAALVGADFLSF